MRNVMESIPLVSVCVPVYNAAPYLRECIDSILAQSFADFELLLADDGSTDDSRAIIRSYADPRVRLIEREHDYIATLNALLDAARGKYVARMDADDRMLKDRLRTQVDYMEAHPEIDLLGGGMLYIGEQSGFHMPDVVGRAVSVADLLKRNVFYHPTVMMRRATMQAHGLRYDREFIYAEDYRLWMVMAREGLHLENLSILLGEYRVTSQRVSSVHSEAQQDAAARVVREAELWMTARERQLAAAQPQTVPTTGNLLTLIIPFLNEGEEVARTVASARQFVGDRVDILVLNDYSDDGYDYRADLAPYGVTYLFNESRLGVAASRDRGVSLCTTPYFLLLDAHMRFYDARWLDRIVALLQADDRMLLCAQTMFLKKDEQGQVGIHLDAVTSYGAFQPWVKTAIQPDITWNNVERYPFDDEEPIPFVLGAGYAASKRYWTYLRGLAGLLHYGSDEAYISLKVWREGGRCLLLKDVVIGHIYRTVAPYRKMSEKHVYNALFISSLLYPQSLRVLSFAIAEWRNPQLFAAACRLLESRKALWQELRDYYQRIFTRSYRDFAPLNRLLQPNQRRDMEQKAALLPLVAEQVLTGVRGPGLFEGRMAAAVWLAEYARATGEAAVRTQVEDLIQEAEDDVYGEALSWNFAYGLCGIGWALLYLRGLGYTAAVREDLLEAVDRQVSVCAPARVADDDLSTGLTGLLAYVTARMGSGGAAFADGFLTELDEAARRLAGRSGELTAIYYARLYQDMRRRGADPDDVPLAVHTWMDYPSFIPAEQRYWRYSLPDGVLGATLVVLLVRNSQTEHHETTAE